MMPFHVVFQEVSDGCNPQEGGLTLPVPQLRGTILHFQSQGVQRLVHRVRARDDGEPAGELTPFPWRHERSLRVIVESNPSNLRRGSALADVSDKATVLPILL